LIPHIKRLEAKTTLHLGATYIMPSNFGFMGVRLITTPEEVTNKLLDLLNHLLREDEHRGPVHIDGGKN